MKWGNSMGKKKKSEEPLSQVIAFNKIGKDEKVYGFDLVFRKYYGLTNEEQRADVNINLVSNEDIDLLISKLEQLKEV